MYAMPYCQGCGRHVEKYKIFNDRKEERSYILCLRCYDKVIEDRPEPPKKGRGGGGIFDQNGPLGRKRLF